MEQKQLPPALEESFGALFHKVNIPSFYLILNDNNENWELAAYLNRERLQRAVGVIYRPERGQTKSHYDHARLAEQFDAVVYFDKTSAVEPIDRMSE
jgi:erythromycin esterase-like protein